MSDEILGVPEAIVIDECVICGGPFLDLTAVVYLRKVGGNAGWLWQVAGNGTEDDAYGVESDVVVHRRCLRGFPLYGSNYN